MELNLPEKYFWDIDVRSLDVKKHRSYIIERIVEFGDAAAVAWLRRHFSGKDILAVVNASRRVSPKTRNFWRLVVRS